MTVSAKDTVDTAIASDFIVIFGKSYCPSTKAAKETIEELDLPEEHKMKDFELDLMRGGEKVQEYLEELTGHSEMPNIFVQGKHIGGHKELDAAKASGELERLTHMKE
ncbi:thioredoxin-like protein [Mrakia frigida]|uniref:glutaredoxin n=1 Tax=Mrakia frigida TaxID=29902 RepID=UPI003FCC1330